MCITVGLSHPAERLQELEGRLDTGVNHRATRVGVRLSGDDTGLDLNMLRCGDWGRRNQSSEAESDDGDEGSGEAHLVNDSEGGGV